MKIIIKKIDYASSEYYNAKILREKILREPIGLKLSKEDIKNENNHAHFIALHEHKVVGTVIIAPIDKGKAKLRQMAIDESFQARGIGGELFLKADKFVRENNYKSLECTARETAKQFYKKMGFIFTGETFLAMGMNIYKMVKYYDE